MEGTRRLCASKDSRLDRLVADELGISRAEAQRLIRSGQVMVDGCPARPSYRVKPEDVVTVTVRESAPAELVALDLSLSVVYEDADCLVVNKPPGLVVHPATSHQNDTLVNALIHAYPEITGLVAGEGAEGSRPGIVHRLDKDTSGLIVVARTKAAVAYLQDQFRSRTLEKAYTALVHGRLDPRGAVEAPIGRHRRHRQRMAVEEQGREALTEYEAQRYLRSPYGGREVYTLAKVWLRTGRTHQIRVHMAHLGHPVVGDAVYGRRREPIPCPRQFLHAEHLGFRRPGDGQWIVCDAPLPEDLQEVLERLEEAG